MLPVCLYKKNDISSSIIENKENLRLIPNKGVLFGKYNSYNNNNLPKISFNYLGQFDNKYNDYWIFMNELSGNNGHNKSRNFITINYFQMNNISEFKVETNLIDSKFIIHNFKSILIKLFLYLNDLKRTYLTSRDVNYVVEQKALNILQSRTERYQKFFFSNISIISKNIIGVNISDL
jgi:non-ribosomal peptide synthase protein (TIGR01720 family)